MSFRFFSVLGLMLVIGVAGLPMADAADDNEFGSKQVRKSSAESRREKTAKSKKASRKMEEDDDEEEEEDGVVDPFFDWYVTDKDAWEKMKAVKLAQVNFSDLNVADFIAYMNTQMNYNQLTIKFKHLEDGSMEEMPAMRSLRLSDVSLTDILRQACTQMNCVYTVENGEVWLYDSKHLFSRTYSVTRDEIYGLYERKSGFVNIMKNMGIRIPDNANISFNNAGDILTVLAPSSTHSDVFFMCQDFAEMRANLPKLAVIYKKYSSALLKVGKAASKVKPGKNAKAKIKKLSDQLRKACPEKEEGFLIYYLSVKPKELEKLKKIEQSLAMPMQNMIDLLDAVGSDAADEASFLHCDMMRFTGEMPVNEILW